MNAKMVATNICYKEPFVPIIRVIVKITYTFEMQTESLLR